VLLEIFIQIGYCTFSKSYARKQKWVFLSEHSVERTCSVLALQQTFNVLETSIEIYT